MEFIAENIVTILTAVGVFFSAITVFYLIRNDRETKTTDPAKVLADIQRESGRLAQNFAECENLTEVWQGVLPETDCPAASAKMGQMLNHYSEIRRKFKAGMISTEDWEPYKDEMKAFANYPYVRKHNAHAKNFGKEFERFFLSL